MYAVLSALSGNADGMGFSAPQAFVVLGDDKYLGTSDFYHLGHTDPGFSGFNYAGMDLLNVRMY